MSLRAVERYLDDAIARAGESAIEGDHQELTANNPLLLATPHDAIIILSGYVDVFAIRLEGGEPAGQRHALFRADRGEIVTGMSCNDYALLVVGVSETTVAVTSLEVLTRVGNDHGAALIDRLTTAHLLALAAEDSLTEVTRMVPGEETEIYRERPVSGTGRRPTWIRSRDVEFALFDSQAGRALCVPVNNAAAATLEATSRVRAIDSRELLAQQDGLEIVIRFLELVGDRVSDIIPKRAELSAQTQINFQQSSARAMHDALGKMTSLITPAGNRMPSLLPRQEGSENTASLHAVFLTVARHLEIDSAATTQRLEPSPTSSLLEQISVAYGIRTRTVMLKEDWWRADLGPLIGYSEGTLEPVALLPSRGGYVAWRPQSGFSEPVDSEFFESLHGEAVMLYRPIDDATVTLRDLVGMISPLIRQDVRRLSLLGLATGALAASVPLLTGILIEDILPRADRTAMFTVIGALVLFAFGSAIFEMLRALGVLRIETRTDLYLQSAIFDRLLRLPVSFFRRFTAGDLADRVLGVQTIRRTLSSTLQQMMLALVTAGFSLLVMFLLDWKLAFIAMALGISGVVVMSFFVARQLGEERQRISKQGQAEGFVIQFLTGLAKLRIAAAEKRAFSKWANHFIEQKRHFTRGQFWANCQQVFQAAFPVAATAVIFIMVSVFFEQDLLAAQLESLVGERSEATVLSTGDFVAFITAFSQLLIAMTVFTLALSSSLTVVPVFERLAPILETATESSSGRVRQELRGHIEVDQATFRYTPDSPAVLNDLSFEIGANEFVAIVGPSGSGKSTIVRLLLGFEQLEHGEVLFDGTPLHDMDIASVRNQISVVQQQSQLSTGSIYSNIVGTANLSVDDAWHAARLAGIAEDIEALPMGMHTVINEGVNTLSGGQRQRLMIARALVSRPRIILLDEPTSALDNRTQETVMKSLAGLNATRIMIAHRLSTIKAADRIFVISGGRLVQQGHYDVLVNEEGPFADLARRQIY